MIKFKLHPEIIPHIFSLKSNFTQLEISYIFKLESMYAIRLYMILACNKKYGKTFTLDRFKDMMGIKDKKTYRLYGNIKQEVLNIAKKEINEKTDIQFDYEENKAGREVVSLKFKVFKGKRINSKSIRYKDEIKRIKAPLCDEAKKFFGRVKK
jgi:plasmid replication initiation protein